MTTKFTLKDILKKAEINSYAWSLQTWVTKHI